MSTAGAQRAPVGTRVARGGGFAGTGQLLRLALRRDRVVGTVWVLGLFVFAFSQGASIISLYPTQADLDRLARTAGGIGANPAVVALQGPAYDASTYGGATAWQLVTPWTFLIGLMSILLVTRHTRQEEETGRAELVSAAAVGRYAWLTSSLLYVLAANLVLAALTALGFVALGLPAAGSVALAVACGVNGLVFAGVAAICVQLTEYARPANGIAFAVLGVAFLLRAVGDTATELSWLSWLSPIGWAERFRPFAGERWEVLLLPVALLGVLLVAAAALLVRRDLGAGVLATRLGPADAAPWLRSPLALAWRLQRGALTGWMVGAAVAGLSFGVLAQDMVQFAAEDPETAELLASLGGSGSIADIYLAAILTWIGMLAAGYAVQATLRLRSEEAELRAEQVLATATPRVGWAGSHLLVAAGGAAVVLATGGLLAGLAHGLRSGDLGGELPRVLAGALVQLPAVWVMAAIGAALFGLLPRLVVAATWAVLAVVLSITMFGEALQLGQWLLHLSPFAHLPKLPAAEFTVTPLVWLLAVAAVLAATGLAGFRRRDLVSSA
jgi:polyether ionophore transport system permease protein